MTLILEASRWQSSQQFSPSTCVPLNEWGCRWQALDHFRMADAFDRKQTVSMQSHNVSTVATTSCQSTTKKKEKHQRLCVQHWRWCRPFPNELWFAQIYVCLLSISTNNIKLRSGFKLPFPLCMTCRAPLNVRRAPLASAGHYIHIADFISVSAIVVCLWFMSFISL